MSVGDRLDIAIAEAGQLGDPQAGVDGRAQKDVVAPTVPGIPATGGQQGRD